MQEYNDIKQRLAELARLRDRTGKDPLTGPERLSLLNEIYDGLLYLWKQAVIMGTAKGTSAISHQLERARLEMVDLERTHGIAGRDLEEDTIGWGQLVGTDGADA